MENRSQSSGLLPNFSRGFMSGATSGAVMMGVYSLIALTNLLHPVGWATIIGMTLCTGLFSGVMAAKRAADEAKPAATAAAARAGRTQETTPVIVPMVGASVSADRAEGPEASWTDRTGGSARSNRIQEILANGSMSDRDRASAILADREAAQSAATQR